MGRERLMRQQRERLQEWRKKKKAPKTPATKKGVTRDTSKDQSRKEVARLTGGSTPATGDAATKRLDKFLGSKPPVAKPAEKKPAPAPTPKPASSPAPVKPKASDKAVEGGYTISKGNRKKPVPTPKPKAQKPKPQRQGGNRARVNRKGNPVNLGDLAKSIDKNLKLTYKKGDIKKIDGITYIHNGTRFVRYTQ